MSRGDITSKINGLKEELIEIDRNIAHWEAMKKVNSEQLRTLRKDLLFYYIDPCTKTYPEIRDTGCKYAEVVKGRIICENPKCDK